MARFEYNITRHSADTLNELIFYCNGDGTCSLDETPEDQIDVLQNILNGIGMDGWELVQISFGRDGFVCFWKRPAGS